jgi:alpha-tubulin suppressor-like RCC1 family protein
MAAVSAISVGTEHAVFLTADGSLWAKGTFNYGEFGMPRGKTFSAPELIMTGIADMYAATKRGFFLKRDGTLWASGDNENGQLGDGTTTSPTLPVQVMASPGVPFTGVAAVRTSESHTLFLKKDGSVWAVGMNINMTLCDGTSENRTFPVRVMAAAGTPVANASAIAAGADHNLILKSDGSVLACGSNSAAGGAGATLLTYATPVLTGVKQIATGYSSSYCLKIDGSLWVTGNNEYGQLGDGTTNEKSAFFQVRTGVEEVAAAHYFSVFRKTDGSVWGSGVNLYGQLGDGTGTGTIVPVRAVVDGVAKLYCGLSATAFLMKDGSIWGTGTFIFHKEKPAMIQY